MNTTPLEEASIEAEYQLIVETLKKTKFNKSKAAELLQINRKTLYNKLNAYEKKIASSMAETKPIPGTY
jgi:two-component system, NtrC family, response regulator HydG